MNNLINKVKDFFNSSSDKKLEAEIEDLKAKLVEKQAVINKTNAYWKKKIYEISKKNKGKN